MLSTKYAKNLNFLPEPPKMQSEPFFLVWEICPDEKPNNVHVQGDIDILSKSQNLIKFLS